MFYIKNLYLHGSYYGFFFMETYYRFLEFLQDLLIPFIRFPLSYQNKFIKKKRKFIGKTKKKNQLNGVRKQLHWYWFILFSNLILISICMLIFVIFSNQILSLLLLVRFWCFSLNVYFKQFTAYTGFPFLESKKTALSQPVLN